MSDTNCNLKTLKLSIGSLQSLDTQSCNMLGSFLHKANIKVIISQQVNHDAILGMFKYLDNDKNGYLDLNEFSVAFDAFRHRKMTKYNNSDVDNKNSGSNEAMNVKEEELKVAVFQRLAIRRLEKRDRMYVYLTHAWSICSCFAFISSVLF